MERVREDVTLTQPSHQLILIIIHAIIIIIIYLII